MQKNFLMIMLGSVLLASATGLSMAENINLNNKVENKNSTSTVSITKGEIKHDCIDLLKDLKLGHGNYKDGNIEEVKNLQDKLIKKGYLRASSTGFFGRATFEAVKKYQRENGLPVTGFVGEKTRGKMRAHFCNDLAGINKDKKDEKNPLDKGPVTADCKVWNDGCNTCTKFTATTSNANAACTLMACPSGNLNKPFCMEYFPKSTSTKSLLKSCPTEKIVNEMPVVCIKAPCKNVERESYYIYNGKRAEIKDFDAEYVRNNCTVRETIVH